MMFKFDPEKRGSLERDYKRLKIHVCNTTREMAGTILAIEGRKKTEASIKETIIYIEQRLLKGLYLNNNLLINLQMINAIHKHPEERETCFVVTSAHEMLHHFGGFDSYNNYDLHWLDEATAELISREIGLVEHPNTLASLGCDSYEADMKLLKEIVDTLRLKSLPEAFFRRDFEILEKELFSKGLSKELINWFLELVNEFGTFGEDLLETQKRKEREKTISKLSDWLIATKKLLEKEKTKEAEPSAQESTLTVGQTNYYQDQSLAELREKARAALLEVNYLHKDNLRRTEKAVFPYLLRILST
ncbi:hypothetical protein HZC08_01705 [Candidatus Micrarchaeota archaeon]|nr:hypothetical protein [Candidatus Micrarchaeota archaeon]